ncbi:hypothetical protein VCR31J2_1310039 [Vibrio coralliirubri]|uniref:Uncharacterized protein n=1 Tax=Vibrio coralliirubri TaxID=1516159 RepID=A0AA86XAZ9_9VIBR|nr:hypothetical protein VCR31J2_1310039 [Vibrio coralliirubri]
MGYKSNGVNRVLVSNEHSVNCDIKAYFMRREAIIISKLFMHAQYILTVAVSEVELLFSHGDREFVVSTPFRP